MDKKHSSTQWSDENKIEMVHLGEYDTFIDIGKDVSAPVLHENIQSI